MTAVVSIVTSALVLTIIAAAITGFAYKERTLCFRDSFKPSFKTKGKSKTRRPSKVHSSIDFPSRHSFTLNNVYLCEHTNVLYLQKTSSDSTKTLADVDNLSDFSDNSKSANKNKKGSRTENIVTVDSIQDQARCRSWVQHASVHTYSQARRPLTPPNKVREHDGPIRPKLVSLGESLYHENITGDNCREITIPRVSRYGGTPQNTSTKPEDYSFSDSSTSSRPYNASEQFDYPKGPAVMYTELQFPPGPAKVQTYINKKDSSDSNVTMHKLSGASHHFENNMIYKRSDFGKSLKDENNEPSAAAIGRIV